MKVNFVTFLKEVVTNVDKSYSYTTSHNLKNSVTFAVSIFEGFFSSAVALGVPAPEAADMMWNAVRVLMQVKFQTKHLNLLKGMIAALSGRFPSSRD